MIGNSCSRSFERKVLTTYLPSNRARDGRLASRHYISVEWEQPLAAVAYSLACRLIGRHHINGTSACMAFQSQDQAVACLCQHVNTTYTVTKVKLPSRQSPKQLLIARRLVQSSILDPYGTGADCSLQLQHALGLTARRHRDRCIVQQQATQGTFKTLCFLRSPYHTSTKHYVSLVELWCYRSFRLQLLSLHHC